MEAPANTRTDLTIYKGVLGGAYPEPLTQAELDALFTDGCHKMLDTGAFLTHVKDCIVRDDDEDDDAEQDVAPAAEQDVAQVEKIDNKELRIPRGTQQAEIRQYRVMLTRRKKQLEKSNEYAHIVTFSGRNYGSQAYLFVKTVNADMVKTSRINNDRFMVPGILYTKLIRDVYMLIKHFYGCEYLMLSLSPWVLEDALVNANLTSPHFADMLPAAMTIPAYVGRYGKYLEMTNIAFKDYIDIHPIVLASFQSPLFKVQRQRRAMIRWGHMRCIVLLYPDEPISKTKERQLARRVVEVDNGKIFKEELAEEIKYRDSMLLKHPGKLVVIIFMPRGNGDDIVPVCKDRTYYKHTDLEFRRIAPAMPYFMIPGQIRQLVAGQPADDSDIDDNSDVEEQDWLSSASM